MGCARAAVFVGCLLLFLAVDASPNKCTVGCHGKHAGKAYQEGHTYVYDLEGTSVTSVPDAQGDATLKLKGIVELTVKPDCIRQIRLKSVQINGAPISLPDVEKHALQFNYHDGHIDAQVCAEPGDSQASLNIKRAVASLFQSAIIQESGSTIHNEIDVFGSCPTDFTFNKEGETLTVKKEKNLNRCAHRENISQGPISVIYDHKSDIQSAPTLNAHQRIEQRFKRGILNKASSLETYKLRPWSNGNLGAKTIIQTTLTLKSDNGDKPAAPVSLSKSLIFEAPHPVVESSVDSIIAAIKGTSTKEHGKVQQHAAEKFSALIRILRHSSKDDILAVYHKISTGSGFDKVHDKKMYLDALFRAASGEAAEVLVELIKKNELANEHTLLFYASLMLIKHVNLPSVTAIATLLDQPNLPRLGYLGIGHVIGKHCQEHSCENIAEVKQAIQKIREKVGNGKAKTRDQENLIVSALKALGNARFLDDATVQKLAAIAEDKNVRNRVRVAAIEALPTRCSMKWKNVLIKVMSDQEEDSEVRIKSYLSMVACPCPHVASAVKNMLDKESVNQVGSFVQSHLRNLRASADPNKAEAKRHLGLIKSRTKFPEDFRKFSFNNELSYNVGGIGIGSSVESNVIYSQNSFAPRSMNFNFTTEVFGRSLNVLELNTRMENLDRMIEHYFGPKGRLTQHDIEHLMDKGANTVQGISEYIKQKIGKLRGKREVKQPELDRFAKGVKLRNNEVDQQLDLDLSVKLFGVEMAYLTYDGTPGQLTPEHIIDKIFDTIEVCFNKAKKFDYNLHNHMEFIDTEVIYPTNLGMSLSLNTIGTSVVNVKLNGKMDIPAIIKNPDNAEIYLNLEPSASVRLASSMVVKDFNVESGMKVVGSMYTDTAVDITVKLLNGQGIDVKIGAPIKKEKPIHLSSEILMSSGPKGDVYKPPKFSKGKMFKDCFEQLSSLLGVTICGEVEFPYNNMETVHKRALFPLNGPSKLTIDWENTDLSTFHFMVLYDTKSPKSRSFEILLDTPNSKANRRVSMTGKIELEPNQSIKLAFDSPIKKASIEAVVKCNPQEHMLTITVLNDNQEYFGRVGLLANGPKYKPILEYKIPEHIEKLANTKTGLKIFQSNQQYKMQGEVELINQNDGKKYVFDKVALVANDQPLVGFDGYVQSAKDMAALDMKINYGEESVALKLRGKKLGERHYSLGVSALPSRDPNIGFDLQWEYHRDKHAFDNNLVFVHGADLKSEMNRFSLKQNLVADQTNLVLGASNKLSYPALKLKLDFSGKLTANSAEGEIAITYDKFKFGSELNAKRDPTKKSDYEVEFEAELLQNSVKFESKRTSVGPQKSKYKNKLELTPGGKYEADVMITRSRDKNVNFELDGDLNLNGKKVKVFGNLKDERPTSVQSRAYITVSDVKYIDFLLKMQRQDGKYPQGNLNLNIKNYLNVVGQLSTQNDKGNAQLDIDLPKINRKIKGNGDLMVSGTQHNANFELLLDAEKDPNKRIKLSTISDIRKNAIDSKNTIEVMNHKLEVNGKGKLDGTFHEGDLNAELDVTLPCGRYIVYHMKRTSAKKNDKYDVHVNADIAVHESKGGPAYKISYEVDANNVNFKDSTFQSNGHLNFVNLNGDKTQLKLNLKNLRDIDDHKKLIEMMVDLAGSPLQRPFSAHYKHNELQNGEDSCDVTSSLGKDLQLKYTRNYVPGNHADKPCTISGNMDLMLPYEKLRNVKLDYKHSLLRQSEMNNIDLQGYTALTYNDDKTIKIEGAYKHSGMSHWDHAHERDLKLKMSVLKLPPIAIEDSYKYEPSENKAKLISKTSVKYDEKDLTLSIDPLTFDHDLSHVEIKAKATTPYKTLRHIDLDLKHEREGHARKTDVAIIADDKKYTAKSEIRDGNVSPMIHIAVTCPNGKTELLSKFEQLGDHEYTGEWKVETPYGFAVADAHVDLESLDNFHINANLDSDKLKHRKIHAEIANQPAVKSGRRITITVTSDGKNIVTGSTSYKKHDEVGKITVEGNGNLKIGENTRSSSFQYTRQQLTREKDGEVGVAIVLNAKFDPAAIVGELKFSNKEILVFNSYCEQNKDCAHVKLQSRYDTDKKTYLNHQITVEVDLKKFNVPAEFGLKTSTEYKENKLDHSTNLYLHSSKDKSEYTYRFYVHPKESAVILTLPNRELAAISTFDLPKTKQTGAFKIDAFIYLDKKNKPSDKTGLIATGDINIQQDTGSLNGDIKFIYPSQPKNMGVSGKLHYGGENLLDANVDIDLFARRMQKISLTAKVKNQAIPMGRNITSLLEINSQGQQLKVDLKSHLAYSDKELGFGNMLSYTDQHKKPKSVGILFAMDPTQVHLHVKSPNRDIIRTDAKMQLQKNLQKFDAELAILNNHPIVFNLEVHDWSNFKYQEYDKDKPNTKLNVNGRVVLGQLAEIHANIFEEGNKQNLFHVLVHLDEGKFLKPDFGYNKDNIMRTIEFYRKWHIDTLKQFKEASVEVANEIETEMKDLVEHLRKAQPNVKPLMEYYETELKKLKEEFQKDQTIKDIQTTFEKHFGAFIVAVNDILVQITKQLAELQKEYNEIIPKVREAWNAISPQLKESYEKITQVSIKILDNIVNVAAAYFKALLDMINEHQKELKELGVMVSEFVQDIAKIAFKGVAQIRKDVEEFVELLINQMKALPVYEYMKEQYQEIKNFHVPDSILISIDELSNTLKSMLPTQELQQLFSDIYEHILKHLKHEKMDHNIEVKKIYQHAIDAIASLIKLLESSSIMDNLLDSLLDIRLPFEVGMLSKLPRFSLPNISLINLLQNNELPTFMDFYYAYRPTLLPSDVIAPFSKIGIVVDGGHIFTFDGNHFGIVGDCTYILAQDMQDGNFSIVANFNKGSLTSVTVTEPKESITLKNNGNILVNNKPAEFPANTKNLHAFLINPTAHIKSDYGVHVTCGYKTAMVCTIRVSGFYHGKLRGLLGDGNNEHYDDYMLPSGKITESETEFANGYKLKSDCAAASAIDHKSHQRNPVCTEYFTGERSTLKKCFDYINPSHYRAACDVAASADPQAACLLASAYYAACYYKRVVGISIPATCTNCKVGDKTIPVGDGFSVKSPQKQADIVVVVEQVALNEKVFKDLVPTLMSDLREELKQHGITDVHIGLIGYADHIKWPQHYTASGNLNIDGDVKNMKFEQPKPIVSLEEAKKGNNDKKITYLEQRLDVEFGTFRLTDAYHEAINYPFRPGAVKAVVGIIASPCEKSPLPVSLQQLRLLLGQLVYGELGLTYYHVYFPGEIQVSDKPQKNIVGYDNHGAYVLTDSKKKPLSGNAELKNNMNLPHPDVCANFAVTSGGAAFVSNNLVDAKPNQKRQFAQVTARKIVEDITSVEIDEDCVCKQGPEGLLAQPRCKIVGRREKEHKHTKGGVKG